MQFEDSLQNAQFFLKNKLKKNWLVSKARNRLGGAVSAGEGLEERETLSALAKYDFPSLPSVASVPDIREAKLNLVRDIKSANSICDYGGLYFVHGKYLLEGAEAIGAKLAVEVDETPRAEFETNSKVFEEKTGGKVQYVQGDFREPALFKKIPKVEVSLLFQVLLHQENAVEVIKNVLSKTQKYCCIAQPCLKESLFTLPNGCINLQFYSENLKDELRSGAFWPKEPPTDRFRTDSWMWGQTTSYLISILKGFGWEVDYALVVKNGFGKHWEFPLLRFRPSGA